MKKTLGFLPAALVVLALAGCKDSKGLTEPPQPVPGLLTVSLSTPHADDRAIVISITGPGPLTELRALSDAHLLHQRGDGTSTLRAAVFGTLANGPVLRFSVTDVNKSSSYGASILEVADASNGLRNALTSYSLTISR